MPFSKYSPKQKKLARIAEPRDAITEADFKELDMKRTKKMGGGYGRKKMMGGGEMMMRWWRNDGPAQADGGRRCRP
jgi:hypothetical protein